MALLSTLRRAFRTIISASPDAGKQPPSTITEIDLGKLDSADLNAVHVALFCRDFDEGKPAFLVLQRFESALGLHEKYGMPGGYLDAGETLAAAAGREIYEETGYTLNAAQISELRLLSSHALHTPEAGELPGKQVHLHAMTLEVARDTMLEIIAGSPRAPQHEASGNPRWEVRQVFPLVVDLQNTDSPLHVLFADTENFYPGTPEQIVAFLRKELAASALQITALQPWYSGRGHSSHTHRLIGIAQGVNLN